MAKKDKLKLGSMNFDTELDFDFDFDKIEGQVNKDMKKGRKPVMSAFKGAISGAKTASMSPAVMQKFLRAALPKEYGEVLDRTGDVTSNISSLYNEAVREIKPNLQKIAKEVDKLVPGEMKRSRGFIAKLKSILGEESTAAYSAENGQEAMLQSKLAEVFQLQAEQTQRQHAEDKVEDRLKSRVEASRFETSFGLMNSINVNLTKLSNYNEKVNAAFQRKTLELQYRSFFVQQELLKSSQQFFETMKAQSEAIAKNTALPDYVKMTQSEFLKSVARQKFMSSGMKLFSNADFIKRAIGTLKEAGKAKIGSIGSAFGGAAMGLEQFNSTRSMMNDMSSLGMEGADGYSMGGQMVGSMLPEWLAGKAGAALRNKIPKKVLDQIYKAHRYTSNVEGSVNKLKRAKGLQFNVDDEMSGFGGRMKNQGREAVMNLLNLITGGGTDIKLDTGGGFRDLRKDARFDNMAHKSLTQVIPGYLSRIFRELQVIRSGNNNVQLTSFDFKSDKFTSQSSLRSGMEKSLAAGLKSNYGDYQVGQTYKLIVGDKKLSKSAEQALRNKIFDSSFSKTGLDADILRSSDFTQGLNQSDALEIQSVIAANLNPLSGDYHKKDMEIARAANEARGSINDIRGDIQALYNAGYGQILKQMGIVTINGDTVSINMETYKKLAREGKLGKSLSKHVKSRNTNAGLTSARQAATPKTSVVGTGATARQSFSFKPNRTAARGDMGGEAIPLLSGIKSNTDVIIQRLDALGQLSHGTPNLSAEELKKFFSGMKNNASDRMHGFGDFVSGQRQKLSDRIGGWAKGNPKTMFGNIQNLAASAGALLVGTIEKVSGGIASGAKNANDRVIQPTVRGAKGMYSKHKDGIIDTAKSLFTSGMGLVGTVFDYAKKGLTDLIENKLPAGYSQLAKSLGWLKGKMKNILDEPADVYVKGRRSPALQAILMRAGAYFDQRTGKPIKNPSDINGPVVNSDGEVVLSLDDIGRGIMDSAGKPFVSISKKLINAGLGVVGNVFDAAKNAFSALTKAGAGLGERVSGALSGFKFGFGGGQQVELLTQIRDLLNTRLPGKRTNFKSIKAGMATKPQPVNDQKEQPSSGGGFFSSLKDKVGGLFSKAKGMSFNPFATPGIIDYKQKEKRSGNADDQLKSRQDRAAEARSKHGTLHASLDPRYKSGQNVLDTIAEKASGVYDTIKSGLSGLADIAGMGGKGRLGRKGGLLKRGIGGLLRTPGAVGRGLMAAGSMLPGAATAARAFTIGRTALMVGGMMLPGMGGAASGALGIIATALGSPVVLGAGALALAGYGAYKGFKFLTRNKISKLTRVRMMQYGISDKYSSFYHQALKLETLLESEALSFQNGQAQLDEKNLNFQHIADIFNVDVEDSGALQNFATWLGQRFKPVFLTHETNVFAINSKVKLSDIDDFKAEEKDRYLNGITGISSAYSVKNSPFKDQEPLEVTSKDIEAAIQEARDEFKDELEEKNKPPSMLKKITNFFTHNDTLDKAASEGGVKGALAKIAKYVPGIVMGMNVIEKGISLASKIGKAIRPFFSGPPSALESVRFKTYGLKIMDRLKISALRDLEDVMNKYVAVVGGKADFSGNIPDLIKEVGSSFGISSVEDDNAKNWINWFQNRFLPTFLNFVGSGFGLIGQANAAQIENRLNDEQRYQLALRVSGTDVWSVNETPWKDNPAVCTNNSECEDNLAFLKQKVSNKEVKEEALKVNNSLANQKLQPPPKFEVPKMYDSMDDGPISSANEGESAQHVNKPISSSSTIKSGPIPVASGAIADPSQGDQFITLGKDVSLNGVNPQLLRNLRGMAAEYGQLTGKTITVNSGFRSQDQQAALYRRDPSKAAKPGTSLHEHGLALDIQSADLNALEELGLMRKYGFTRPIGSEPWHMEPAGIQANIGLAKSDPAHATSMIATSLGKGGGGYGTIAGATLGKRDSTLALSLLGTDAPTKNVNTTMKDTAVAALNAGSAYKSSIDATRSSGSSTTILASAGSTGIFSGIGGSEGESPKLGKAFGYNENTTGNVGGGVKSTINEAAKMAGVDATLMQSFAAVESGMNPNAKASKGSASGLFQFTDKTWRGMLSKYGSKYGIDPNTSPTDAKANSLMAAEYMKENIKSISKNRPNPSAADVYAAHFLGASGANKMFSADPSTSAVDLLPEAANNNRSIFYKPDGSPRTVAELQSHLSNKIQTASAQHGVSGSTALASAGQTPSILAQNSQGRLATNAIVPANDASYGQPPRTTAPSTFVAPEMIPPGPTTPVQTVSLTGIPPTVGGVRSGFTPRIVERGQGLTSGRQGDPVGNIDQTLTQSLGVQNEMLVALKQLVAKMGPEQFQAAVQSVTADAASQVSKGTKPAPEAAVSLARKVS